MVVAEDSKYSMVQIKVNKDDVASLHQLGLAIDCCSYQEERDGQVMFEVPVNQDELKMLQERERLRMEKEALKTKKL